MADISSDRLEAARLLGAEQTVDSKREDAVKAGLEFSGADGVDYVIDAVGSATTKAQSLAVLRPNGAACWIGLQEDQMALNSHAITLTQKTVIGSYAFTEQEFLLAARLLATGGMRSAPGIRTFPLPDAVAAFRRMARPNGDDLKAVIIP
jgi:threonine dehydrogenase-like Zn-dependent dehydrogenase